MVFLDYIGLGLSAFFFILAAICNALMDTLADEPHFNKSIFGDKNPDFWLKQDSWDNKYNDINGDGEGDYKGGLRFKGIFGFMNNFLDAWHIAKMGMIFSIAFSVVFFPLAFKFCVFNSNFLNGLLWLGILGVCWNTPFNLFYNKIFVKKEKDK